MDARATVPLMAPVLGIDPGAAYQTAGANPGQQFDQIAAAVKDYLLACVGSGPGLLVFENIHWYDEDTVELVKALLRDNHKNLLVLVTGRQVPFLQEDVDDLELQPLGDEHAEVLIRALHPGLTASARAVVTQRCDGIPLFIEEVVAKLRHPIDGSGDTAMVPDTLYEALVARLRSSTNSLLVVEAAALIGNRFDRELLSAASGLDPTEIDSLLEELTEARVLRRMGEHNWGFHHELLEKLPRNSLRPAFADDCITGLPMRSPRGRSRAPPTGNWSHITSRRPRG